MCVVRPADGMVLDANEAFELLVGKDRRHLLGKPFAGAAPWVDPRIWPRVFGSLLRSSEIREVETGMERPDGRVALLSTSVRGVQIGRRRCALAVVRDVSGHWEANRGSRTASLYARSLIEASLDPLVTISPLGKITDVNRATEQATGLSRGELVGTDFADYFTEPEKARDGYQRVLAEGQVRDYALTLRHRSGRTVDVLYNAAVYRNEAGELQGVFAAARDVTLRKRAEAASARLAAIIESSSDAVLGEDLEGTVTSLNRGAERLYGYAAAEIVGRSVGILAPPERQQETQELIEKVRRGEDVSHFETVRVRKDGSQVEVSLSISPIRDPQGAMAGVSTIARDITDRKRAERQLRTASLYARSLIEASLDPLVTISPQGKITDVNRATEQATGLSRADLVGTDFADYFTEPEKARAGYQRVLAEGEVRDYPLTIRHRSEGTVDVLYNAAVYRNEAGDLQGVFAAARDVTVRKRLEAEARAASLYARSLIEASLDPLVTISPQGKITDVNRATEEATGLPRVDLVGTDFADYFTEPDRALIGYQRVLAEGQVRDYPLTIRHRSGGTADVLYNATVYRNEAGGRQGVFAAARDVTVRKRLEEEVRKHRDELEHLVEQRTAELEAAYKELEGFSYSVSHDLRTPLRAIDGFSRVLLEEHRQQLDEEGRRLLGVVREGTSRMSHLIDDMLAFSRMGRVHMSMEDVDMEALIRAVHEEILAASPGRDVRLDVGPLPPARGDRAMLRQVLANLLGNAFKFTRTRTPALIEIRGIADGAEHQYQVKDNGVGFDMRYADKLFGVFQRLHPATEFEGTGIGLALVKRIVARHGGRVWAEGRPDEGATFHFALPSGRGGQP